MKPLEPPPVCKAFLVCDKLIQDASSGNFSLINIVNCFDFRIFPAQSAPVMCYLQLTNGIGRYRFTFEFHNLSTGRMVIGAPVEELDFPDRASVHTLHFPVIGLPIAMPGKYDFVVLADNQEVDRVQITVRQSQEFPHGQTKFIED